MDGNIDKQNKDPKTERLLTRRRFLQAASSAAAAAAIGEGLLRTPDAIYALRKADIREKTFKRWDEVPVNERAGAFEKAATEFQIFVRSPAGAEILNNGSDQQIFDLIRAMVAIDQESIRGTPLDYPLSSWPSVAFTSQKLDKLDTPVTAVAAQARNLKAGGNAVLITPDTLLTNCHVLAYSLLDAPAGTHEARERDRIMSLFDYSSNRDAVLITAADPDGLKPLLSDGGRVFPLSNASDDALHGSSVCVTSIDKDPNSRVDGTKIRYSTTIRVSEHLARFIVKYCDFDPENAIETRLWVEKLTGLYLTIGNPGGAIQGVAESVSGSRFLDAVGGRFPSREKFDRATSGSPVIQNGETVGTQCAIDVLRFPGSPTPIELTHFVGAPAIHALAGAGHRYVVDTFATAH